MTSVQGPPPVPPPAPPAAPPTVPPQADLFRGSLRVVVQGTSVDGPSGRYQCTISPGGLLLEKAGRQAIEVPLGSGAKHSHDNVLMVQTAVGPLRLTVRAFGKFETRLARDLAEFLCRQRPAPRPDDYGLKPLYLLISVYCFWGGLLGIVVSKLAQKEDLHPGVRAGIIYAMAAALFAIIFGLAFYLVAQLRPNGGGVVYSTSVDRGVYSPPMRTPPAVERTPRPASPAEAADYSTILLARKLPAMLNMNALQRAQAVLLKEELQARLAGVPAISAEQGGMSALAMLGETMRSRLTAAQASRFDELVRRGEIAHVVVSPLILRHNDVPVASSLEYIVKYTPWNESPSDSALGEAGPAGGVLRVNAHFLPNAGRVQEALVALLRTPDDAIQLAGASEAVLKAAAIQWLKTAKVDEAARRGVVKALGAMMDSSPAMLHPEEAVVAYCRWVNREDVPAMLASFRGRALQGSGRLIAQRLLELDEKAVEDAVKDGAGERALLTALQEVSFGSTPQQAAAKRLTDLARAASIASRTARPVAATGPAGLPSFSPRPRPDAQPVVNSLDSAVTGLTVEGTRAQAVKWLAAAELKDPNDRLVACIALRPLMTAGEASSRENAVKAFARHAGPGEANDLVVVARQTDRTLIGTWGPAMLALFRVNAATARAVFEERRDDFFFRTHVCNALTASDSELEPAVWPLLRSRHADVRQDACDILRRMGTEKSIPRLEDALNALENKADRASLKLRVDRAIAEIRSRTAKK